MWESGASIMFQERTAPSKPWRKTASRDSAACADALPFASSELDGALCRGVTEALAVTDMHARVKALRAGGAAVFFAAMEE